MEGTIPSVTKYPTAVKLLRITSWVHLPRLKPVSYKSQQEPEESYSCEPVEDFRYLFKTTDKWLHVAVMGWPTHPCVSDYHALILPLFRTPFPW